MKKHLIKWVIFCLLFIQTSFAQYQQNKTRAFETLVNLPILNSDWRCMDIEENYYSSWRKEVYNCSIINNFTSPYIGIYIQPDNPAFNPVIVINPALFTNRDNGDIVLEHELYHCALKGTYLIPGWMLFLGNKSDTGECCNASERIAQALVTRRDIIDLFGLSLSTILTPSQILNYIIYQEIVGRHDGINNLVKTTTFENLIKLLNFQNGYEL